MKTNALRFCSAVAILTLLGVSATTSLAQDAATTYKTKCAGCHGADGKGNPAMVKSLGLRDFSSAEVQKETDAELIGIIQNGKNKMPSYAKSLKADQIKALVSYIRDLTKK
jgi:mono/diheme cytochrome c family protein